MHVVVHQPFTSLPLVPTAKNPAVPSPFTSPGLASPENLYSGHLPAFSWCEPSGRPTTENSFASRPTSWPTPATVWGSPTFAHTPTHVGVPRLSSVKP